MTFIEEPVVYYRRLPHMQFLGSNFFITWRLFGSLPVEVILRLQKERDDSIESIRKENLPDEEKELKVEVIKSKYLQVIDNELDTIKTGPHHLKNENIAQLVLDKMKSYDGIYYDLQAYCIMSNHVHALMDFSIQIPENHDEFMAENYTQLSKIMKWIKGSTGFEANKILDLKDKFWQEENFDRYIRNEKHRQTVINYIHQNPVKAGICKNPEDYKWSSAYRSSGFNPKMENGF